MREVEMENKVNFFYVKDEKIVREEKRREQESKSYMYSHT